LDDFADPASFEEEDDGLVLVETLGTSEFPGRNVAVRVSQATINANLETVIILSVNLAIQSF
jgi:hypothetical protein